MSENLMPIWGAVCVKLLRNSISENDGDLWKTFKNYAPEIENYFNKIGLTVFWDEADGYAVLKQLDDDSITIEENGSIIEDEERIRNKVDELPTNFPRLITRQKLTYGQTQLCVMLRDELEKFNTSQNGNAFLTMRESEMRELVSTSFKQKNDQLKSRKEFSNWVKKLEDLSFIEELESSKKNTAENKDREFRIMPILKAKVNLTFLQEFKEKLSALKNGKMILNDKENIEGEKDA